MSMLKKVVFALCLLSLSGLPAYCQKDQDKDEGKKLTREDILVSMKDMSDAVINGYPEAERGPTNSPMISSLALKEIGKTCKEYHDLPEIEKITGYSREWFGTLMKIVQELEKISVEAGKTAGNSQQLDKLKKLNEEYGELQKAYKKTYEKPQKPK